MNRTLSPRRAAMLAAITSISQLTAPMASANSTGGAGVGIGNTAPGQQAFVGGGYLNKASSDYTTIGGGYYNAASEPYATIVGGAYNTNRGNNSTLGGGFQNTIRSSFATIVGGRDNTNSGVLATIGGGYLNKAGGSYATVPGGARAIARHEGAFVWSGVSTVNTASTNKFSFTVRAPGGVRFITTAATSGLDIRNRGGVNGVAVRPGGTAWVTLSDRESKTDFQTIKPREVLSKLAAMPVTSWQYKHDPSRRYIGPTSQDFMEAFHLGSDDKGINTLDADGVTFAAIKGLVEELKERDTRHAKDLAARDQTIEELKVRNSELTRSIEAINERLKSLPPAP